MYLDHYGLTRKPFQITADPNFLWLGEKHEEALAMLRYGVLNGAGFLLLTGDVGTGKTSLVNALLKDLPRHVLVANVVNPTLERWEFFCALARAFGIRNRVANKTEFVEVFGKFLALAHRHGKRLLLIVDEAHDLSLELLEEVRLLSNLDRQDEKLLTIVLVGQDELAKTLRKKECRALNQRIAARFHIGPLTAKETPVYVNHRLRVAGGRHEIFEKRALRRVHRMSQGYPRLINVLCDHALLAGYVGDLKTIPAPVIRQCAADLDLPRPADANGDGEPRAPRRGLLRLLPRILVAFLGFLGFLIIGSALAYVWSEPRHQAYRTALEQLFGRPPAGKSSPAPEPGHRGQEIRLPVTHRAPHSGAVRRVKEGEGQSAPEGERADGAQGNSGLPSSGPAAAVAGPHPGEAPSAREGKRYAHDSSTGERRFVSLAEVIAKETARAARDEPASGATQTGSDNGGPMEPVKWVIPFPHKGGTLPPAAHDVLDKIAHTMSRDPSITITVTGHTDDIGDPSYNKVLSLRRAGGIRDYLVEKGVSPSRIETVGAGQDNPLAPNRTEEGREANRRVEIELRQV